MMRYRSSQPFATLTAAQGGVTLRSSYDAGLVADLKATIPSSARRFDGESKAWTVAPLDRLAKAHSGKSVTAKCADQLAEKAKTLLLGA